MIIHIIQHDNLYLLKIISSRIDHIYNFNIIVNNSIKNKQQPSQ